MNKFSYTKTLRLNAQNIGGLWEKLDKYPSSFDNIVFFSHHTHSVKNLDYHRATASKLAPVIERLRGMHIKAGFNILGTVGFFSENNDPLLADMPKYRTITAAVNEGKLCPTSTQTADYVRELYGIYASVRPDIIYIDDDIDELNCTCDGCLKRFAKKLGIKDTIDFNLDKLRNLFDNNDREVRQRAREAWIDHTVSVRAELCALIEQTVHSIYPDIMLGFMTFTSGIGSFGCELWAKRLSGIDRCEISWRPGGGVYTDDSLYKVCDKANRISLQTRYIPVSVTRIESEIENFPYQPLNKSPDFTAYESFIYQAAGCTGTAYNVMSKEEDIGEEHEIFFKMAEESGEYGRLISQAFKRSPLRGVGYKWNPMTPTVPQKASWSLFEAIPLANDIHRIGIPFACEDESTYVYFLNGDIACQLSDDELCECLSKCVFMDCEALRVCNERGLGHLCGFRTAERYDSDTMEIELDHPLNMPGEHRRNPRQAFHYTGYTYTIERTNERAEYLAKQTDIEGKYRGMSAGVFENELGGRIYVSGVTPFEWCYSLARVLHIKNVLRWLSRDSLPAYISSFHRAIIWSRSESAFVANASMADIETVEIMLKTKHKRLRAIITKGSKIIEDTIVNAKSAGTYMKFTIREIPILGTALLTPIYD